MECRYARCAKSCRVRITVLDIVFIYAFSVASCGAYLVKTPSNIAVIVGERMEMECRTSGSIFRGWNFVQVGSDTLRTIAFNDNINIAIVPNMSQFGVDLDQKGSITLYSNSTKTNDAGVYTCQRETGSTEFKHSAQLIVIESKPSCDTNATAKTSLADGDYIWMQCRVNFSGNWAPTMEWRQHQINTDINGGRLVSDVVDTVVILNSSITSTLTVLIDSSNYDSYYSCLTYFTWHNGTLKTDATNVPDFNHTWISNLTFSARPTTTILTDTTHKNNMGNNDFIYLLFGVLSAALLLMMLATAAICCVIVRRKTAEMMAKVVSTYENRERPRSARSSLRFAMDTLRRHTRTISTVERRAREPSEGYTSVEELTEECNQAIGERPTTSGAPQYGAVLKKRPPGVGAAAAGEQYSLAKEETLYYATLRKNIEPPDWRTNDDGEDSDSESEDLK